MGKRDEEFEQLIPDEAACITYLAKAKWGGKVPRCTNGHEVSLLSGERKTRCPVCRNRVSVTAGTYFHDLRKNLLPYAEMMWRVAGEPLPYSVSTTWLREKSDLCYNTASTALCRLRDLMFCLIAATRLSGRVEFLYVQHCDCKSTKFGDYLSKANAKAKKRGEKPITAFIILAEREDTDCILAACQDTETENLSRAKIGHIRIEPISEGTSDEELREKLKGMLSDGQNEKGLPTCIYGQQPSPISPKRLPSHFCTTRLPADEWVDETRAVAQTWDTFNNWFEKAYQPVLTGKRVEDYLDEFVFGENIRRHIDARNHASRRRGGKTESQRMCVFYTLWLNAADTHLWAERQKSLKSEGKSSGDNRPVVDKKRKRRAPVKE